MSTRDTNLKFILVTNDNCCWLSQEVFFLYYILSAELYTVIERKRGEGGEDWPRENSYVSDL